MSYSGYEITQSNSHLIPYPHNERNRGNNSSIGSAVRSIQHGAEQTDWKNGIEEKFHRRVIGYGNYSDAKKLTSKIEKIPINNRKEVAHLFIDCISHMMSTYDKKIILELVSRLSNDERAQFAAMLKKAPEAIHNIHSFYMLCALVGILNIPYEYRKIHQILKDHPDRENIIDLILPFIENRVDKVTSLVQSLALFRNSQRKEILDLAQQIDKNKLTEIFELIETIPDNNRLEVLRIAEKWSFKDIVEFREFFYALSKLDDVLLVEQGMERIATLCPGKGLFGRCTLAIKVELTYRIGALSESAWLDALNEGKNWSCRKGQNDENSGAAEIIMAAALGPIFARYEHREKLTSLMDRLFEQNTVLCELFKTAPENRLLWVNTASSLAEKNVRDTKGLYKFVREAIQIYAPNKEQVIAFAINLKTNGDYSKMKDALQDISDPQIISHAFKIFIRNSDSSIDSINYILKSLNIEEKKLVTEILELVIAKNREHLIYELFGSSPPIFPFSMKEIPYTTRNEYVEALKLEYKSFEMILQMISQGKITLENAMWITDHNCIDLLLSLPLEKNYQVLLESIIQVAKNQRAQELYEKLTQSKPQKSYRILMNIQLALLQADLDKNLKEKLEFLQHELHELGSLASSKRTTEEEKIHQLSQQIKAIRSLLQKELKGQIQLELAPFETEIESLQAEAKAIREKHNFDTLYNKIKQIGSGLPGQEAKRELDQLQKQIEAIKASEEYKKESARIGEISKTIYAIRNKKMKEITTHLQNKMEKELALKTDPLLNEIEEIKASDGYLNGAASHQKIEEILIKIKEIKSRIHAIDMAIERFRIIYQTVFPGNIEAAALIEMLILLQKTTDLSSEIKGKLLLELSSGLDRTVNLEGRLEPLKDYKMRIRAQDKQKNSKSLSHRIHILLLILQYKKENYLMEEGAAVDEIANSICWQELQVPKSITAEEISIKFKNDLIPNCFFTYATGLKSLENLEIMQTLGRFVGSVCNGTFREKRYEIENNSHLTAIHASQPEKLKQWIRLPEDMGKKSITLTPSDFNAFDFKAWIEEKEAHGHLTFESLSEWIDNNGLSQSFKETSNLIEKMMESGARTKEEEIENFLKLQKFFDLLPKCEFQEDIRKKLVDLQKPAIPTINISQKAVIRVTDDPLEIFLAGSVKDSCQSLYSIPQFNRGVLGYVQNGYNLMIRIDDEQGNLLARALFKLPINDQKEPVLFLEASYFGSSCSQEYENSCREAMVEFAREVAKEKMHTNLFAVKGNYDRQEGDPLNELLYFLECNSPCEYSDAAYGVQLGAYTIGTRENNGGLPPLVSLNSNPP